VLLPALAWLQYSWLDQIADADRERRRRTLQTAASQLAQDLDGELGKAIFNLQLEPGLVEQANWSAYAERYQRWTDSAITPNMVKSVYFIPTPEDRPDAAEPALRVWNTATDAFDETSWPEELASLRGKFIHDPHAVLPVIPRRGERGRGMQRLILPPAPAGDEQSIVVPVMRMFGGTMVGRMSPTPPEVKLLGFTIIRLDLGAVRQELLPSLVKRHMFGEEGRSDFLVAVVARDDASRVIFESEADAARIATAAPDVVAPLLGPRLGPLLFMARDGRRGGAPPPPPPPPSETDNRVVVDVIESRRIDTGVQARTFSAGEGQWRLVATHRSGSLEAAVASARTRNFLLSSGILLLLTTAIGLIVVSARRADRLARQQLEFVAAVSHELRTPVSVIGAAAGNLADGVVDEPGRVKKYGATIQSEARRLAETVERVLQLAGIAAGRAAGSPMIIAGRDLINDALTALGHDIDAAGVTVERDVPDSLPSVAGDALALRSALQNLIGNAVKYAGDARWVRVSAQGGDRLRISVEDRGLGISADDRKHIFEPFYRGREAVSRQIHGSGLGLHLVRRIVEAHGGKMSVRSERGRGSTFVMELPVASDKAATPNLALSTTSSR
jgi:signal transduction histidine kinase